jgi:hypothetical protein
MNPMKVQTKGDTMSALLTDKLREVVDLVDKVMIDPDIDVEYYIPDVLVTANGQTGADPFILVKYHEDDYVERKFSLDERHVHGSAKEIANFVTFSIEQFKEEVDSLRYGAQ